MRFKLAIVRSAIKKRKKIISVSLTNSNILSDNLVDDLVLTAIFVEKSTALLTEIVVRENKLFLKNGDRVTVIVK